MLGSSQHSLVQVVRRKRLGAEFTQGLVSTSLFGWRLACRRRWTVSVIGANRALDNVRACSRMVRSTMLSVLHGLQEVWFVLASVVWAVVQIIITGFLWNGLVAWGNIRRAHELRDPVQDLPEWMSLEHPSRGRRLPSLFPSVAKKRDPERPGRLHHRSRPFGGLSFYESSDEPERSRPPRRLDVSACSPPRAFLVRGVVSRAHARLVSAQL